MTKFTGWYVAPDGETLEVEATHTTNPKIVDLSAANLGLAVVDLQFFEDQADALEQAKFNAEDTIARCEERLAEMDKPKRGKQVSSKPSFFRKTKDTDPLGPPEYGVGRYMRNKKSGGEYKIIGFRDDEEVLYILSGKSGNLRLNRAAVDRQFEVVE